MMTFFMLGNICGIATEKLVQGREKSYDFLRKVGMNVMFSAGVMKLNLLWERCPGECGVGSQVAGRGRMFCSQCPISQRPHDGARGFHSSLGNFCNLFHKLPVQQKVVLHRDFYQLFSCNFHTH